MQNEELEKANKLIEDQKKLIDQKNGELESLNKEVEGIREEFQKVKQSAETLRQQCQTLDKQCGELKQKLNEANKENIALVAQSAQQRGSLQAQINKLTEDIKKRDEVEEEERTSQINKLKDALRKSKAKCEELEQTAESSKKKVDILREENTQKHTAYILSNEEVKQLRDQVSALEIENSVIKAKIGLVESRFNQQMKQYKDAVGVESAAKEARYKAERARIIEENEKRRSKFMLDMTSLFRKKIDVSKPLDEEMCLKLVETSLESEEKALQEAEKLHDLERQDKTIRQLLKAENGVRTVALIQDLVEWKSQ